MERLLSEPAIVPDIYVSGFVGPEDLGNGCFRYTGYAQQEDLIQFGGVQYVIVNRLVVPLNVMMQTIKDTMNALGLSCCGAERLKRIAH